MRYVISGKNIEVTEALKEKVVSKLSKMEKYFTRDVEAKITLSVEKLRQIVEVTIPLKGSVLRAEAESDNMYSSIDTIADIVEKQFLKHRKKLIDRHKGAETFRVDFVDENIEHNDRDIQIERSKKFPVKPMTPEEACMEMDLLGHDFFVFRNAETEEVSVVYKRKRGSYGMIEAEY